MGYRSFPNDTAHYLATATTPLITAPPFWMMVKCRSTAVGADHIFGIYAATGQNFHCLRQNVGVAGMNSNSGLVNEALAPTLINDGQWHVLVGQVVTTGTRSIYAGNFANAGWNTDAEAVIGIAAAAIGRRNDTPGQPYTGDVAWAALGYGPLTPMQIRAALADESPLDVARASIRHYWVMTGDAAAEPDLVGGMPMVVTGTTFTSGAPAIPRRRNSVARDIGISSTPAGTIRKVRFRVSVADVWKEVKIPLGDKTYAAVIAEIDTTEARLRLDDGAAQAVALGGTANAQTGSLYAGVGLTSAAVVTEGADAGRWSAIHGFSSVLDAGGIAQLQEDLADHLAPITTSATLVVPANGTAQLDVTPYVRDLEQGWAITGVSSATPDWTATALSGTTIEVDTTALTGSAAIEVTVSNNRTPRRSATIAVSAGITNVAFPNGFLFRRRITIPVVPTAAYEDLLRFPLLFSVTGAAWLKSVSNGGDVQYNNALVDLRLEGVDGTIYPHEIEPGGYDPAAGTITAWVGIPHWNPTQAYSFFAYYGNRLTSSIEDYSLWGEYLIVHHGGPDERNPANPALNWDISGIVESAGYVGSGSDCADPLSLASISDPATLNGHETLTINLAKKSASLASSAGVIGAGDLTADSSAALYVRDGASITGGPLTITQSTVAKIATTGGVVRWIGPNGFTSTDYQNLLLTWQTGETLVVYADGELVPDTSSGLARGGVTACGVSPLVLGRSAGYAVLGRWTSEFDEVRFCRVFRSARWAAAEHASWQPGFLTVGAEETPATAIDLIQPLPDRGVLRPPSGFIDLAVLGNDVASELLALVSVTQPVGGPSVEILNTRDVRFQLNGAPDNTSYTYTYTSTDGTLTASASTVTIVVDEFPTAPVATLSIAPDAATVTEPLSGSTNVVFTVTRGGDLTQQIVVNWAKTGTTAAADFVSGQAFAGQLGFAPGQTSRTITLALAADVLVESDETIIVTLSGAVPTDTVIAVPSASTTVTNTANQASIAIAANSPTVVEPDFGETNVVFTVTRSGDTTGVSTVSVAKTGTTNESDFAWWDLPRRSGRAWSGGIAYWFDRTGNPVAPGLSGEELDVGLIDSVSGSSKASDRGNVSTWDRLLGGPITGPLDSTDTQFDWAPATDFGFGVGVDHLPTGGIYATHGSGWLFWAGQFIPADRSTQGGNSSIWTEIIAGTHDAKYIKFGERVVTKMAAVGHPLKRLIIDFHHEMNQSNDYQVFAGTRTNYRDAMERIIDKVREGAGARIRFCHRPGFRADAGDTKIGPYISYVPRNVDVLAISCHPDGLCNSNTAITQLFNGTLHPQWYGIQEMLDAATTMNLPIAFPEWSPKYEAGTDTGYTWERACPVANTFTTRFYNEILFPNRARLVADGVFNQNIRLTGEWAGTASGGAAQWNAMVATRKSLWFGVGLPATLPTPPATLTWTAGQTTKTITFRLQGQTATEAAESLILTLSNPVGCIISQSTAQTTISQPGDPEEPPPLLPPVAIAPFPNITGNLTVGSTLTCTFGSWTNTPTSGNFRWNDGADFANGPTVSSVVLTSAQVGRTIRCIVRAINADGFGEVSSNQVGPVLAAPGAPVNITAPVITTTSGPAFAVGSTLTCSFGSWTNTPTSNNFRWNDGADFLSAPNASSVVLTGIQVNRTVRCIVRAINAFGFGERSSNEIVVVPAPPPPGAPVAISPFPTITGALTVGSVLTCTFGTWTGSPTSGNFQWWNDDAVFASGSGLNQITLTAGQVGQSISCVITATNAFGSTFRASNLHGPVINQPVDPPPPGNRPKHPGTASRTIRVPEDEPTLQAAYDAAAAGNHISLSSGNHSGITLDRTFPVTNPVVIRSRSVNSSRPVATITGPIIHSAPGHWLYELGISYRGSSDQTSAVRVGSSGLTVTRCYFTAPMAINIPHGNRTKIYIGWNAFRGGNPTSGESCIRVWNSSSLSSPTASLHDSAIYRNYFKDTSNTAGESHTFYIGSSKMDPSSAGWMDFYFEENLIDAGDTRIREVYMKSGCWCIRNRVKESSPSTGFRHGFGGKFWGNRITGDVMVNDGHGTADGRHHDLRDNVWTGLCELHGGSQNGSGGALHQAASWTVLVGNNGRIEIGAIPGSDAPSTWNGESASVHDVKIYAHNGNVSNGPRAGSNNTQQAGRDGGPSSTCPDWGVTDVGFQLASQAT